MVSIRLCEVWLEIKEATPGAICGYSAEILIMNALFNPFIHRGIGRCGRLNHQMADIILDNNTVGNHGVCYVAERVRFRSWESHELIVSQPSCNVAECSMVTIITCARKS